MLHQVACAAAVVATVALVGTAAAANPAPLPPPLPLVNLRSDTVTISGFDSGAMFATQYQFSYSDTIHAAALASVAPWACAQNTVSGADVCMTAPEIVNMDLFYTEASSQESQGHLANLTNLRDHYVSIQSAPLDPVVVHGTSILAAGMYGKYQVRSLETVYDIPSDRHKSPTHAWVTSKYGNPCSYLGDPYVNNCGFDYAGHFLSGAFRHMQQPFAPVGPNATFNASNMYEFDQVAYGANDLKNSMGNAGYIFVPPQCMQTPGGNNSLKCHLHIHFHGCHQSKTTVGTDYVTKTEINEHAEANNIVVLYPQAAPNALKYNPLGCWDWFGYNQQTDLLSYATNKGVQTRMVRSIVAALLSGYA